MGTGGTLLADELALPKVIPVHFDDYGVFASPLTDFVAEMKRAGMGDRIIELDRGARPTLRPARGRLAADLLRWLPRRYIVPLIRYSNEKRSGGHL
jgi:hypothetical protein